jgi:hypothetical protein
VPFEVTGLGVSRVIIEHLGAAQLGVRRKFQLGD